MQAVTGKTQTNVAAMPSKSPAAKVPLQRWLRRAWTRENLLLLGALLLVAGFLVHELRNNAELGFSEDEARHALTGVYFADFLSDLPLSDPVAYTYRYYAQYPALGIIHWPPFFHFTEGIVFLLVGPSAGAARLTILLFALLGLLFWFKIVREFSNPWAAAFATVALGLLPPIFQWEQAVMLEVPSLALCLAATYYWIRYLHTGRSRLLYLFAVLLALAMLTRQHSFYLLVFCTLALLMQRKWWKLLSWNVLWAGLLAAALVLPYYLLALRVHGPVIGEHVVQSEAYNWSQVTFYVTRLPSMLGWPMLLLSLIGMATCFLWDKRGHWRVMLVWIAACYLSFTFLSARDPRYILYWLPPFVYFATWPAIANFSPRRIRVMAAALCVLVLASYGWQAARTVEYPYLSGYSELAHWLSSATHGRQRILFDGSHNGNFIFYLRLHDHSRRFVVIRKGLYVVRIIEYFGSKELVQTPEQIRQVLAQYGIRYIVVSDDPEAISFPVQVTLRDLLRTSQFKLVREFPVDFGHSSLRRNRLLVYENQQAGAPSNPELRIPMMTLGRDIVVPLEDLGNP